MNAGSDPAPPGGPRPTLAGVAARAGVSLATASKALSANPARCDLSPATVERVKAAAAALGYRPPAGKVRSPARSIGLVFAAAAPDFRGVYERFPGLLAEHARARGYRLAYLPVAGPDEWREQLRWHPLHAAIFMHPCLPGIPHLARAEGLPVVLVNLGLPAGLPAVACDDRDGATRLAAHLAGRGCRRLVLARGEHVQDHPSVAERRQGASSAAAAAGARLRELVYRDRDRDALAAGLADADGVLGHSHFDAINCLAALTAAGRRVPDDCLLASCDDVGALALTSPAITALRLPIAALAEAAAGMAVEQIERPDSPPPRPVVLAEELVERGSTARRAQ